MWDYVDWSLFYSENEYGENETVVYGVATPMTWLDSLLDWFVGIKWRSM